MDMGQQSQMFIRSEEGKEGGMDADNTPYAYYKGILSELVKTGALNAQNQQIKQSTIDFVLSCQKDPISLLNTYCSSSREPTFPFYGYEIAGRNKEKFITFSELNGCPVIGLCASSKKEAKKACALRILDILMDQQRLNCISEKGRKVKNPAQRPRPLPTNIQTPNLNQSMESFSTIQDQSRNDSSFAEDIDLDKIQREFEKHNPVPADCSNANTFLSVRTRAFQLFYENAFWQEVQLSERTQSKLEEFKMNVILFVTKCLENAAALEQQRQQEEKPGQNEGDPNQTITSESQEQAESAEKTGQSEQKQSQPHLEYFMFTLPYIPAHFAALALLNGELYHGAISISKQKAKTSCAAVLAEKLVQEGYADVKFKRRKSSPRKVQKKKRKMDTNEQEDSDGGGLEKHHFILTLHPLEKLEPKTHFFLASQNKNPVQILNEFYTRGQIENVEYGEEKDEQTSATTFTAKTGSITVRGAQELAKKAAKSSAARGVVDELVKAGKIAVDEDGLTSFITNLKKICDHFDGGVGKKTAEAEGISEGSIPNI